MIELNAVCDFCGRREFLGADNRDLVYPEKWLPIPDGVKPLEDCIHVCSAECKIAWVGRDLKREELTADAAALSAKNAEAKSSAELAEANSR